MYGTISILLILFGGYYALSYREGMLENQIKPIEQEVIKNEK